MVEALLRFVAGGTLVCAFALLGDLFKPKAFAGLFAAAPSIALASLALTVAANGWDYAALEARAMVAGSAAFLLYACVVSKVLARWRLSPLRVATAFLALWLAAALIFHAAGSRWL